MKINGINGQPKKLNVWLFLIVQITFKMISLDQVKKKEIIGQGNFCETFRVEDKDQKSYAAQVFYVDYEDYEKSRQYQMERTMFLATDLDHPAILKGYDYSLTGFGKEHRPSILFDYLPNGSLEKCIPQLDETKKIINLFGIATAMKNLHQNYILHYDLKTSNVLETNEYYPKLKHIKYSKVFDSLTSIAKAHKFNANIAPETCISNEYTKKSEVYAFAYLAYEVVLNKKPFEGLSQFEMMTKITKGERPELPIDMSTLYKIIIDRCWSQEPKDRPSFLEICQVLQHH